MVARPTWQGHLKLSLVTCPVALYAATTQTNDVSFHLINPNYIFSSISRQITSTSCASHAPGCAFDAPPHTLMRRRLTIQIEETSCMAPPGAG